MEEGGRAEPRPRGAPQVAEEEEATEQRHGAFVPRGVLSTAETCYISAVLQALAASPSAAAYFRMLSLAIGQDEGGGGGDDGGGGDSAASDGDDGKKRNPTRAPLAMAVADLLRQLSTPPLPASASAPSPVDPSAAIAALSEHHRDFAAPGGGAQHQDAAEALEALCSAVADEARAWLRADVAPVLSGLGALLPPEDEEADDDETKNPEEEAEDGKEAAAAAPSVPPLLPPPAPRRPAPSLARAKEDAAAAAAKAAAAPRITAAAAPEPLLELWRISSPPLEGQLLHLRVCLSCGNRAERALSPFFLLPLPVPAAAVDGGGSAAAAAPIPVVRPGATLDDCMRMFTGQEVLSDVRCVRCGLRRALVAAERAAAVLPPPTPEQQAARRELAELASGAGGAAGPLADDDIIDLRALARRAGLPPLGLGGAARARGAFGGSSGGGGGGGGGSGGGSTALRQTVICRAPAVLALQLLRALPGQRKLHGRVSYPLLLDLSGFVLAGEERAAAAAAAAAAGDEAAAAASPSLLYALVAVVQHLGIGTGRGHYVTYRRMGGGALVGPPSSSSSSWVRASDGRVDACPQDEALGCDGAALLLYERVDLFAPGADASGGLLVGGGGG